MACKASQACILKTALYIAGILPSVWLCCMATPLKDVEEVDVAKNVRSCALDFAFAAMFRGVFHPHHDICIYKLYIYMYVHVYIYIYISLESGKHGHESPQSVDDWNCFNSPVPWNDSRYSIESWGASTAPKLPVSEPAIRGTAADPGLWFLGGV